MLEAYPKEGLSFVGSRRLLLKNSSNAPADVSLRVEPPSAPFQACPSVFTIAANSSVNVTVTAIGSGSDDASGASTAVLVASAGGEGGTAVVEVDLAVNGETETGRSVAEFQEENERLHATVAELRRAVPSVAKLVALEVGLERTAAEDKGRRALELLRRKDATIRQLQQRLRTGAFKGSTDEHQQQQQQQQQSYAAELQAALDASNNEAAELRKQGREQAQALQALVDEVARLRQQAVTSDRAATAGDDDAAALRKKLTDVEGLLAQQAQAMKEAAAQAVMERSAWTREKAACAAQEASLIAQVERLERLQATAKQTALASEAALKQAVSQLQAQGTAAAAIASASALERLVRVAAASVEAAAHPPPPPAASSPSILRRDTRIGSNVGSTSMKPDGGIDDTSVAAHHGGSETGSQRESAHDDTAESAAEREQHQLREQLASSKEGALVGVYLGAQAWWLQLSEKLHKTSSTASQVTGSDSGEMSLEVKRLRQALHDQSLALALSKQGELRIEAEARAKDRAWADKTAVLSAANAALAQALETAKRAGAAQLELQRRTIDTLRGRGDLSAALAAARAELSRETEARVSAQGDAAVQRQVLKEERQRRQEAMRDLADAQEALDRRAVAATVAEPDASAAACGVTASTLLDHFAGTAAAQALRIKQLTHDNTKLKDAVRRHDANAGAGSARIDSGGGSDAWSAALSSAACSALRLRAEALEKELEEAREGVITAQQEAAEASRAAAAAARAAQAARDEALSTAEVDLLSAREEIEALRAALADLRNANSTGPSLALTPQHSPLPAHKQHHNSAQHAAIGGHGSQRQQGASAESTLQAEIQSLRSLLDERESQVRVLTASVEALQGATTCSAAAEAGSDGEGLESGLAVLSRLGAQGMLKHCIGLTIQVTSLHGRLGLSERREQASAARLEHLHTDKLATERRLQATLSSLKAEQSAKDRAIAELCALRDEGRQRIGDAVEENRRLRLSLAQAHKNCVRETERAAKAVAEASTWEATARDARERHARDITTATEDANQRVQEALERAFATRNDSGSAMARAVQDAVHAWSRDSSNAQSSSSKSGLPRRAVRTFQTIAATLDTMAQTAVRKSRWLEWDARRLRQLLADERARCEEQAADIARLAGVLEVTQRVRGTAAAAAEGGEAASLLYLEERVQTLAHDLLDAAAARAGAEVKAAQALEHANAAQAAARNACADRDDTAAKAHAAAISAAVAGSGGASETELRQYLLQNIESWWEWEFAPLLGGLKLTQQSGPQDESPQDESTPLFGGVSTPNVVGGVGTPNVGTPYTSQHGRTPGSTPFMEGHGMGGNTPASVVGPGQRMRSPAWGGDLQLTPQDALAAALVASKLDAVQHEGRLDRALRARDAAAAHARDLLALLQQQQQQQRSRGSGGAGSGSAGGDGGVIAGGAAGAVLREWEALAAETARLRQQLSTAQGQLMSMGAQAARQACTIRQLRALCDRLRADESRARETLADRVSGVRQELGRRCSTQLGEVKETVAEERLRFTREVAAQTAETMRLQAEITQLKLRLQEAQEAPARAQPGQTPGGDESPAGVGQPPACSPEIGSRSNTGLAIQEDRDRLQRVAAHLAEQLRVEQRGRRDAEAECDRLGTECAKLKSQLRSLGDRADAQRQALDQLQKQLEKADTCNSGVDATGAETGEAAVGYMLGEVLQVGAPAPGPLAKALVEAKVAMADLDRRLRATAAGETRVRRMLARRDRRIAELKALLRATRPRAGASLSSGVGAAPAPGPSDLEAFDPSLPAAKLWKRVSDQTAIIHSLELQLAEAVARGGGQRSTTARDHRDAEDPIGGCPVCAALREQLRDAEARRIKAENERDTMITSAQQQQEDPAAQAAAEREAARLAAMQAAQAERDALQSDNLKLRGELLKLKHAQPDIEQQAPGSPRQLQDQQQQHRDGGGDNSGMQEDGQERDANDHRAAAAAAETARLASRVEELSQELAEDQARNGRTIAELERQSQELRAAHRTTVAATAQQLQELETAQKASIAALSDALRQAKARAAKALCPQCRQRKGAALPSRQQPSGATTASSRARSSTGKPQAQVPSQQCSVPAHQELMGLLAASDAERLQVKADLDSARYQVKSLSAQLAAAERHSHVATAVAGPAQVTAHEADQDGQSHSGSSGGGASLMAALVLQRAKALAAEEEIARLHAVAEDREETRLQVEHELSALRLKFARGKFSAATPPAQELLEQLAEMKRSAKAEATKLRSQLAAASAALKAKPTKADVEALVQEADQARAALAGARAEVERRARTTAVLRGGQLAEEAKVAALKSRTQELELQLQQSQRDLQAKTSLVSDLKRKREELEALLAAATAHARANSAACGGFASAEEAAALKDKVKGLMTERGRLRTQVAELKTLCGAEQQKAAESAAEAEQLRAKVKALEKKVAALVSDVSAKARHAATIEHEMTALNQEFLQHKAAMAAWQQDAHASLQESDQEAGLCQRATHAIAQKLSALQAALVTALQALYDDALASTSTMTSTSPSSPQSSNAAAVNASLISSLLDMTVDEVDDIVGAERAQERAAFAAHARAAAEAGDAALLSAVLCVLRDAQHAAAAVSQQQQQQQQQASSATPTTAAQVPDGRDAECASFEQQQQRRPRQQDLLLLSPDPLRHSPVQSPPQRQRHTDMRSPRPQQPPSPLPHSPISARKSQVLSFASFDDDGSDVDIEAVDDFDPDTEPPLLSVQPGEGGMGGWFEVEGQFVENS